MSSPFPPAAGLAERFTSLTRGLLLVVSQQAHRHPAALPLLSVFCRWLMRLPQRFARLAARAAAGTLPARPAAPRTTPRPPRPPPGEAPARPPSLPRQRLPGSRMWVLRVLQPTAHDAAAYANELRDLMAHPDMQALLELAPQARRLLRPLCRLLTPDAIPVLGLKAYRERPAARPRPAPAPANTAATTPPAPPTPYGQGPRDFDPDQYHRHPFLPGHLARRPGG